MSSTKEVQSGLGEEKERRQWGGGGKAVSSWKVSSLLPLLSFSLNISFFLYPPLPFCHLSIFLHFYSLTLLSLGFPRSLHHSLSPHLCRSPKRATLAKQGISRSEANLLWEVNTGDFCCPENRCIDLGMKVSNRHIKSIAFERDYCWYESLTFLNWKPAWVQKWQGKGSMWIHNSVLSLNVFFILFLQVRKFKLYNWKLVWKWRINT